MSLTPLDHLVPPDDATDDALRDALAADAVQRLRRALRAWGRYAGSAPSIADFTGLAPSAGRFRCWLAEVEDSLAVAAQASLVVRAVAKRRRSHPAWSRLIDLAADAGALPMLAPRGRIPDDFAERALREARRRLASSARALGPLARQPLSIGGEPEVGPRLIERGLEVVQGERDHGFEGRVMKAIAMLDAAWPQAAAMIRARTWRVVPVTAWATVSYSSARQPGIVYINLDSAPLIRLAEDLVHETTHARVHEFEAIEPLVAASALRASDGEPPRFYSPWRREWRPLRGLVHAVCTFTAGATYFERILTASERPEGTVGAGAARRRWLARRLLEERASVAMSLRALRAAGRQRMLTGAGLRVVAAAAREHRALARPAARREAWLAATAAGRAELAAVERLVGTLRRHPVRWGWPDEREDASSR